MNPAHGGEIPVLASNFDRQNLCKNIGGLRLSSYEKGYPAGCNLFVNRMFGRLTERLQ